MGEATWIFEPVVDALGAFFKVSGLPGAAKENRDPAREIYESLRIVDDVASANYMSRMQLLGRGIRTGQLSRTEVKHALECLSREIRELRENLSSAAGEFYTPQEALRCPADLAGDPCEPVEVLVRPQWGSGVHLLQAEYKDHHPAPLFDSSFDFLSSVVQNTSAVPLLAHRSSLGAAVTPCKSWSLQLSIPVRHRARNLLLWFLERLRGELRQLFGDTCIRLAPAEFLPSPVLTLVAVCRRYGHRDDEPRRCLLDPPHHKPEAGRA